MRVLCLPGFRQTASHFVANGAGILREALAKEGVELVVHQAARTEGKICWWDASDDDPPKYVGFADSLSSLSDAWRDLGPFDGCLGFSQGAAVASLMASTAGSKFPGLRFVVCCGGFVVRDPLAHEMLANASSIRIPSLHLIGNADDVVSPARSLELSNYFRDPTVVRHEQGHCVPTDPLACAALSAFFEKHALYPS